MKAFLSRFRGLIRRQPVASTAVVGLLVQLGRPLVSLITVPVLLSRLGQEAFGLWLIALSLLGLIGFINAGISSAVVTAIARASADESGLELRRLVSAAVLVAAAWCALVAVIAIPAALTIDWHSLLHLGASIEPIEVTRLMVAIAATMSAGFVASVPRHVMLGCQHGYLANAVDFVGILVSAALLVAGLYASAPLWLLAFAFIAPQYATLLAGGLVYLKRAGIPIFSTAHLNGRVLKSVAMESGRLGVYQCAFAVSSQSDLFLIGVILGAPAGVAYGVAQRLFALLMLAGATVNYAQWPMLAKADAAGDSEKVARVYRQTMLVGSAAGTAAAVLLALLYDHVVRLWLGRVLETDPLIIAGMVAWVMVATLVNTSDTLLRAKGATAFITRAMVAMAAINIAATVLLLHLVGSAGAIFGSVIGFAFGLLLPYVLRIRHILGEDARARDSQPQGALQLSPQQD